MTSDTYTRDRRSDWDDRDRPAGAGFFLVVIISVVSTAVILIAALVYYGGSNARIASDYTNIATPFNRVLTAERAAYNKDRNSDLAATKSDLAKELKTMGNFDSDLSSVTFPDAPMAVEGSILTADGKLEKLLQRQQKAPTLADIRSLDPAVAAAATNVKTQVALIRQDLGAPPSTGPLW